MRALIIAIALAASASAVRADTLASANSIEAANRQARQAPSQGRFEDAVDYYEFRPGAIYELHTTPGFVSTILLEPGETLVDKAAGDTARWMVEESRSGAGAQARTVVLVKPTTIGLHTNLILITDRRFYLIEAFSRASSAYAAEIAWRYPLTDASRQSLPNPAPASAAVLNAAYQWRTVRGWRPHWFPARVWDDGQRTFIEFPPDIAASDMPPIFLVTGEGAELVNYRVLANRYEVDRLFDVAELRLGVRAPVIVRIERGRVTQPVRRPHRAHP